MGPLHSDGLKACLYPVSDLCMCCPFGFSQTHTFNGGKKYKKLRAVKGEICFISVLISLWQELFLAVSMSLKMPSDKGLVQKMKSLTIALLKVLKKRSGEDLKR